METRDDCEPGGEGQGSQTSNVPLAIAVLVAAVLVRSFWALICEIRGTLFLGGNPLSFGEMASIATNLAQHRGFSFPFGTGSTPTAWECPVVPSIYAVLIRMAGGPNHHAVSLIIYLQAVVGGLGAWLYWVLVRGFVRRYPGRFADWLAGAAAIVVCLWPESVGSVTQFWYFVWQEAGLGLFLLLAFEWSEQPTARRAVLAGLSGGLLALINVTPILIVLSAILFVAMRSGFRPVALRSAGLASLCFIAVIAPWLVRNAIVFHTRVPLRSNTGYEVFQGNNPLECIREPAMAPHPANHGGEYQLYMQMGEIQYCRFSFDRAVQYIRDHPVQTVRRIGDRVYVTWITDVAEHWMPKGEIPWWQESLRFRLRYIVTAALTIVSTASFVWGLIFGRFRRLPYAPMLASILILLPFPHYFTLADPQYTTTFRMMVALTSICMLALRVDRTKAVSQQ